MLNPRLDAHAAFQPNALLARVQQANADGVLRPDKYAQLLTLAERYWAVIQAGEY